jgi:hypothetical protein
MAKAAAAIDTKGKSKITAKEVIAARKLKASHPKMSMQAIKDKLHLKIHVIMVGRAIRGITHAHLDMCGLPVRPFNSGDAKPSANKTAKKKAATPAAKSAGKRKVGRKTKAAKTEAVAATETAG